MGLGTRGEATQVLQKHPPIEDEDIDEDEDWTVEVEGLHWASIVGVASMGSRKVHFLALCLTAMALVSVVSGYAHQQPKKPVYRAKKRQPAAHFCAACGLFVKKTYYYGSWAPYPNSPPPPAYKYSSPPPPPYVYNSPPPPAYVYNSPPPPAYVYSSPPPPAYVYSSPPPPAFENTSPPSEGY
ncbi:hypothetical protein AXG93_3612s1040 [Marchantia polymorpha subsp. ruderalis]|uniref:Uncharacterized protein n=1 Tax=Marchantia polymorpha subsp. ruderalis TaxID=1480154 RepID=A0A176WCM2_MARPO|nr:hypothetical protein AXG93_3612s1040 [Marchantia polymorpha subsp. ruderalis]